MLAAVSMPLTERVSIQLWSRFQVDVYVVMENKIKNKSTVGYGYVFAHKLSINRADISKMIGPCLFMTKLSKG